MKVILKFISIFLLFCFCHPSAFPKSKKVDFRSYLEDIVSSEGHFWVKVHAAEALIENNFTFDAETKFQAALRSNGDEKVGALRVLAKQHENNQAVVDSLSAVLLKFFYQSTDQRTKLLALETMGKLGLYYPDEEIKLLAADSLDEKRTMARWVLSNSGKSEDLLPLISSLYSADTVQFKHAAYALGFKNDIPEEHFTQLEKRYQEIEAGHPCRIYLLKALYLLSTGNRTDGFKEELLRYVSGQSFERYEVFQALAKKGDKSDLTLIGSNLEDPDKDVRVSMAHAYLANEHHLKSQLKWFDWAIFILYAGSMLLIGWYYSKQQKNKEDFYLGGRKSNPVVSGISMYIAFFSAISFLSVPGEVIRYGPVFGLAIIVGAPIIYFLGAHYLIPFFMNLNIISAYQILEKAFGKGTQKIASFTFIITRLLWMALLMFLTSKTVIVMMGWNTDLLIVITVILGVITICYTVMGGLKAVLLTDLIQFLILFLGATITIVIVLVEFGGISEIIPSSWSAHWEKVDFVSFNPYIRLTILFAFINNIAWWLCTAGSDQMAIQRFLTTKDLKSARQTFATTQTSNALIAAVLIIVGFSVLKFYNMHPNLLPKADGPVDKDFLFPYFISTQFPPGMLGLIIAALFSASMSSLSAGINSVGSVITTDVLPSFFKNKSLSEDLKNIRMNSVIIGVFVVFLSLVIPYVPGNIVEVTTKTNGIFVAPLFNLFFMAFFVKKANPFGVFMGSAYGLLTSFTIGFWDVLTGNMPLSFLWITLSSLLVSIISSFVFSILFPSVKGNKSLLVGFTLLIPWIIFYILII